MFGWTHLWNGAVWGFRSQKWWEQRQRLRLGNIPSGGFCEACSLFLLSLVIYYPIWGLSLTPCAEYSSSNFILYWRMSSLTIWTNSVFDLFQMSEGHLDITLDDFFQKNNLLKWTVIKCIKSANVAHVIIHFQKVVCVSLPTMIYGMKSRPIAYWILETHSESF